MAASRNSGGALFTPRSKAGSGASTQPSQLIETLFSDTDDEQRLNILHLGTPCSDTMDFLAGYRCRVHVADLFRDLPLPPAEELEVGLESHVSDLLLLDHGTRFDICLFWDVLNHLDANTVSALLSILKPQLKPAARIHGFSAHNPRAPASGHLYGIRDSRTLSIRQRASPVPCYAPHSQNSLKAILRGFTQERSVLLSDGRLELLLRAPDSQPAGSSKELGNV
ncbi:MAG: hypothetical protein AAGA91_13370 [Pseudomonadota bacterium]